jgi:hypothetical protein
VEVFVYARKCTVRQLFNSYFCNQFIYDWVLTRRILFKVGSTRKQIAVAYGQKGGKDNLGILENLVTTSAHLHL